MATAAAKKARIGVLGASGYTGAELVRLLIRHPAVEIALLTADRRAGQEMRQVFPQFSPFELPKLQSIEGMDWAGAGLDLIFCALPHGSTQKVIQQIVATLPGSKVVVGDGPAAVLDGLDREGRFAGRRSGRASAIPRPTVAAPRSALVAKAPCAMR